jgi:hypothetical protein
MSEPSVTRLVGVYDADGSLLGEAAYVWGKLRGTRHCALCDITHGRVRRKPAWDRMVARLGISVELLHLDELTPDVAEAVATHRVPVVLAETVDGLRPVVRAEELDRLDGSVERLGELLEAHLRVERA